jgi:hypothetical protein
VYIAYSLSAVMVVAAYLYGIFAVGEVENW